ncbi:hypothetical protein ACFPVS_08240, partial [Neisseria weixii]|uniref:hypothetical protein n=1 Tax=Neisseria weixii TaxID=1853276 RepID=UPI003606E46E
SAPMIVWFFHVKVGHCQTPIPKPLTLSGASLRPASMQPKCGDDETILKRSADKVCVIDIE